MLRSKYRVLPLSILLALVLRIKAYINRGIAKCKFGKYAEAIKDFDKAIELDPNLAYAYYNRGLTKKNLGQLKFGNADMATAKKLDPNIGK